MKARSLLVVVSIVGLLALVLIHITLHISHHSDENASSNDGAYSMEITRLIELIHAQNKTIATLSGLAASNKKDTTIEVTSESARKRDALSQRLGAVACNASAQIPMQSSPTSSRPTMLTGIDGQCEQLYGLSLVDSWRNNAQTWCDSKTPSESKLICYPYHQMHKRKDGRGPDLFCHATNFFVDFSKISGKHATRGKPQSGQQYLNFQRGSLSSACKLTSNYRPQLFMPHHSLQMNSFEPNSKAPETFIVEEMPTYLLARDEDCENSFHSTADFMNMFLVMLALEQSPKAMQVMLFDRHPDGPYKELIQKAFSGGRAPIRAEHYANKIVLFRSLIFHLESPAGLIFPKVYNIMGTPEPLRCRNAGLFSAYSRFVLEAFNLWDVPPPPIPQVTLSLRHRTDSKNVGRILANEKAVIAVLQGGNMMNLEIVDTSKMPYGKQLELIRRTNVLVGVHGAGLMLIMFAANEAVLVEIHPSYRQDRHFRHAARMVGRAYLPMRSNIRETCQGSSDNVVVPIDEFRRTMDGALRLARNFDDGISECGLSCPLGFLALDTRLQPHYKPGEPRAGKINTDFPC